MQPEWEFAARGGLSGKPFVWGDHLQPGGTWMANTYQGQFPVKDTNRAEDGHAGIAPVAQYPPNGYGLGEGSTLFARAERTPRQADQRERATHRAADAVLYELKPHMTVLGHYHQGNSFRRSGKRGAPVP